MPIENTMQNAGANLATNATEAGATLAEFAATVRDIDNNALTADVVAQRLGDAWLRNLRQMSRGYFDAVAIAASVLNPNA